MPARRFFSPLHALLGLGLGLGVVPKARAQDYPYEEPSDGLPTEGAPAPALKKDAESPAEKPAASPPPEINRAAPKRPRLKRVNAIFRMGVKLGGNVMVVKSAGSPSSKGWGLSAAFALGWDLPYQPIFLEAETGYRSFFQNHNPVSTIPFRFGVFYRDRIGKQSVWRPGVAVSVDATFEHDDVDDTHSFELAPALHLVSMWELNSFILEPALLFYRVGNSSTLIGLEFRAGYRF